MYLSIKELLINEDEDGTGIQAISFVDNPAIETNFQYFANQKTKISSISDMTMIDLDKKYKWILGSGGENCEACIKWSKEEPKTLRNWIKTAIPRIPVGTNILGLTTEKSWEGEPVKEGPIFNTYCMSNCKCHLQLVENDFEHHFVKMEMVSESKREVKGLVLKSGQLIYRNNVGNGKPGYVYFSRDTVRKLKSRYGWNRSITYQHKDNILGSAILMDTYLEEDEKETRWFVKYKIINDKLWNKIKDNTVRGFSVELIAS